jgi:thioredoxin-dependent peroxiredoxin
LGVKVVGASVDSVDVLKRFRDKFSLGFPFISDKDRRLGKAYGTLKGDETTSDERDTVVVDRSGKIQLAYQRVAAKGHAAAVLADVKKLREEGRLGE